jgi:hypothetical protein
MGILGIMGKKAKKMVRVIYGIKIVFFGRMPFFVDGMPLRFRLLHILFVYL